MTHPLCVSPDYVPIDKREKERTVTVNTEPKTRSRKTRSRKNPRYEVALKYGFKRNYFCSKTVTNRAKYLMGAGDIEKGYLHYRKTAETLIEKMHLLCASLDATPWGFRMFNAYMGKHDTFTQGLRDYVKKRGITLWGGMQAVHRVVKAFERIEQMRKTPLQYIPIERRHPLNKIFVKKYYWKEALTVEAIADMLCVPEGWVRGEITRLGMTKKENVVSRLGIKKTGAANDKRRT